VFSQGDLKANCSYILDSGSVAVFVWHGARSSARARQLAVRCAKAYVGTTLMGVDTVSTITTATVHMQLERMLSLSYILLVTAPTLRQQQHAHAVR
jgi:Gelsolin repeat